MTSSAADTPVALPLVFCSIDTPQIDRALALAAAMQRAGCGIKLGLEFFGSCGPQGVKDIRTAYPDLPLFLDLKFHDIPNTVAAAIRAVVPLAPAYVNVHAAGGLEMMQEAQEAALHTASHEGVPPPRVLAVTVLTSLDDEGLSGIGFAGTASQTVAGLAALAKSAGLAGVVCSGHEIESLRLICGADFTLMVPGIRPSGAQTQDQKRVMTPSDAVRRGASHLVIGRPITAAADPAQAARDILSSI